MGRLKMREGKTRHAGAENAGVEKQAWSKMQGLKMRQWKTQLLHFQCSRCDVCVAPAPWVQLFASIDNG